MNTHNLIPGLLYALIVPALSGGLFAQAGSLDPTFDGDGKVTADLLSGNNMAYSVALQPDGKIVTVGYAINAGFDFAVMRHLMDGTLDTTFSADGRLTTEFFPGKSNEAMSVAVQPDGRIVVVGYTYDLSNNLAMALARYLTDGSLDTSFSADGLLTISFSNGIWTGSGAQAVTIQPDGKILVAGGANDGPYSDFAVARLSTNGTLDSSFSVDGKVTTSLFVYDDAVAAIDVQPDGKIVVAGNLDSFDFGDFAVVRYNTDGTLDNSFSFDGTLIMDVGEANTARSVAVQPDGKILVAGHSVDTAYNFALVRYNIDGTLDTALDGDGIVTTPIGSANSMALQPDGKIVVAGYTYDSLGYANFEVARYHPNGTLDTGFNGDGTATTFFGDNGEARSMAVQPDGKIVVAGWAFNGMDYDFALARYLTDLNVGLIDLSGPDVAMLVYPNPIGEEGILQYELTKEETISIRLIDLQGSVLHTFMENQAQSAGEHQQRIVVPKGLASGAYLIAVSSPVGQVGIRIVK